MLKKTVGYIIMLVLAMAVAGCATSGNKPPAVSQEVAKVNLDMLVYSASQGQAKLVKTFDGPGDLIGLIIKGTSMSGKSAIAWATPDGKNLIMGGVFDVHGQNLSPKAYEKHVAPALSVGPDAIYDRVAQAPSVSQFSAGSEKTLYIFLDPDCIYCNILFGMIGNMGEVFKKNNVRVNYVMVGSRGPDSAKRAAAVLKGGLSALQANYTSFNTTLHHGGIDGINDTAFLRKVDKNTTLLLNSGETPATPTLVYQTADGVMIDAGVPSRVQIKTIVSTVLDDY